MLTKGNYCDSQVLSFLILLCGLIATYFSFSLNRKLINSGNSEEKNNVFLRFQSFLQSSC